jgi:hypothetical protein
MRIITFGDSWTEGHGVEEDEKYKENVLPPTFIKKLRMMNSWPRWVADKLKCEFVNMGVCGYGNEYIFNDLKETIENGFISKDDVVIIMLSYPYRYSADTYNVVEIFKKMEITLQNYNHYYFNSFYPTFKNEDFDLNNLPPYFINPSESVSDILRDYEIKNDVGVWEYGSRTVWNDQKGLHEGDYHPNLVGYKIIGEYIFEQIKNKI